MQNPNHITYDGEEVHIHLHGGLTAKLDRSLAHLVEHNALKVVLTRNNIYARRGGRLLHHLVMAALHPGLRLGRKERIDHINGEGLDCREVNLRVTTPSVNGFNSVDRENRTTGVRGTYRRDDRFIAQICVENRVIHLGSFASLAEAKAARWAAEAHYLPGGKPLKVNPLFRWACAHA